MASMTFLQLQNDALLQADDQNSSPARTIIKSGINESYSEVAGIRDWETLDNSTTVAGVAGTEEYTPITSSSSVPRIRRIQSILDQTNSKYIDIIERSVFEKSYPYVDATTDQGTPKIAYVSGYTSNRDVKIKFYQVPNSSITYNIIFTEEPLALTADGDIPRIPDQFHYGLNYLGLAKYYEYQKDPAGNYYRQLHEEFKKKILTIEYDNTDDMPQIEPNTSIRGFITGKLGRIYNR